MSKVTRGIFEKPLVELTWADFDDIVARQLEESQTLEFKESLPVKDRKEGNNSDDSWQLGRDRIGEYARDALAEEVVAFANAYGGIVIVGIEETNDNPKRAKGFKDPLVRDCIECVERLGPALKSRFDPPISGFDIRAVPKPGGEGEGLIVIRVASSTLAPHGVGKPPVAHVRRGNVKDPLTMRDLHNLFWETRTRRERIVQIRDERRQFLKVLDRKKREGRITSIYGKPVPPSVRHLGFRCTAIPEEPLDLRGIAAEPSRRSLELPSLRQKDGLSVNHLFGRGSLSPGWQPRAHGVRAEYCSDGAFGLWTANDDGVVDITGLSLSQHPIDSGRHLHSPRWFSVTVAQVLLMAEKLRLRAGRPDVPFVIDAQFHHDGTAGASLSQNEWLNNNSADTMEEDVQIGPYELVTREEVPMSYQQIEEQICYGMGVSRVIQTDIDFDSAFSQYLTA